MKLFIKRDTSTKLSGFNVFDELAKLKYTVHYKKSGSVTKLCIEDTNNCQLGVIRRIKVSGVCVYLISFKGKGSISTLINCNKDNFMCLLYGTNWRICGDIRTKNFSIIDVDKTAIAMQKRLFSNSTAAYELNIKSKENELAALAVAVCINLINTVDNFATQAV